MLEKISFYKILIFSHQGNNDITLNVSARPPRARGGEQPKTKVETIKEEAQDLKEKVIQNIVANISDQSQPGTVVESAAFIDLSVEYRIGTKS